ncbi:hypothetical protein SA9_12355, partial [Staphylococcus warneri]
PAQQFDGALARRAPGAAAVAQNRLCDLVADGEARVERGHRLLEDEADLLGPDVVELVAGQRHQVAALEHDLAFDDLARRHRDQFQDRHRGDGLAAAGFADQPQRLAARDVEADVGDGMDGLPAHRIFDDEVLHLHQRIGCSLQHHAPTLAVIGWKQA